MKKVVLFSIFTVFTLVFSSCSKDEDGVSNASEASIIGTWNLTALEATDGRSDTNFDGTSFPTTFDAVGKDFDKRRFVHHSTYNYNNGRNINRGGGR